MKLRSKHFQVPAREEIKLRDYATSIEPFCKSKKRYKTLLNAHVDRLSKLQRLTEWNFGSYEGRLTVDVHRERPDWYIFRDGAPGGESSEQVADRADRFIQRVRPMDGDVAAFSSGQIIRMIVARWLGLPPLDAQLFFTDTASVRIPGYERDLLHSAVNLWDDVGSFDSRD